MCGKEELRIGHWNTRWWDPGGGLVYCEGSLEDT
jgi:hypothetical protein